LYSNKIFRRLIQGNKMDRSNSELIKYAL